MKVLFFLTGAGVDKDLGGADWAVSVCSAVPSSAPFESRSGESWFLSGYHFTSYNHCTPPNAKIPDCSLIQYVEGIHDRGMVEGVFAARSRHPGGVNVLLMDGAVRLAKDSTSLPAWRALGTKAGHEIDSPWRD